MKYPYYIVQTQKGRLPCPPEYRNTVIAKEFTSGRIGGKKTTEEKTDDPSEAYLLWLRSNRQATVYEVPRRNSPRRRMRTDELTRAIRDRENQNDTPTCN